MFDARKHPRHKSGPRKGQYMAKGGKKKGAKKSAKPKSAPRKSSKRSKGTVVATAAQLASIGVKPDKTKLRFLDGQGNLRQSKKLTGGKRGKRKNCRTVCKTR